MARFTTVLREILVRVSRDPSASQADMAEELKRNRSSINSCMKRLVKLGHLERNGFGDYRVTERGKEMLKPSPAARIYRCPDCGRKFSI
jgi:Mn-dependent DtxR family transcriptional regulator